MATFLLLIFTFLVPLENKTSTWFNFGGGINLTTLFLVLIIISWLIAKGESPFFLKNKLNLPILLFILATYFSLWTGFFKFGISPFGSDFNACKRFITTFLLFYITAGICKEKKQFKALINIMTFMILLISVVVLKEFMSSDVWHYSDDIRIQILGMNPNYLGAMLAQYIPLFAASFFMLKGIKPRIFNFILFAIGMFALMFTYSRGSYLAIAGALLVMGFVGGKKSLTGIIILIVLALSVSFFSFGKGRLIPVSVKERFESISEGDKSIDARKDVWSIATDAIKESPIFGYGFGATRRLLPIDIHNMYLRIAFDSGIPALLIFIWLLFRAFKIALKAFYKTKDDFYKTVSLGFIGSLVALTIGNYFGERLDMVAVNGYFAILMAIVVRISMEQKKPDNLKASRKLSI